MLWHLQGFVASIMIEEGLLAVRRRVVSANSRWVGRMTFSVYTLWMYEALGKTSEDVLALN